MYIKRFDEWTEVKKKIEKEERIISLRKGDIRWCSIGVNVGMEIDGKGAGFTRPVLVLRVIGSHLALVAPLSTKIKTIPGYIAFDFQGKTLSVCANQIKMISQKRIYERQGKMSNNKFLALREEIFKFLM
jgi:mRNA interferase MazF